MLDKRSRIGKMIDNTKVVYECLMCGRKFIGGAEEDTSRCNYCTHKDCIVIVDNLSVIDKGVY